jgi:hypothetical protein
MPFISSPCASSRRVVSRICVRDRGALYDRERMVHAEQQHGAEREAHVEEPAPAARQPLERTEHPEAAVRRRRRLRTLGLSTATLALVGTAGLLLARCGAAPPSASEPQSDAAWAFGSLPPGATSFSADLVERLETAWRTGQRRSDRRPARWA